MTDHDSSMERDDPKNSGEQSSATRPVVSQSTANKILKQLKKMEKSLEGEIQRRAAEPRSTSWADREI